MDGHRTSAASAVSDQQKFVDQHICDFHRGICDGDFGVVLLAGGHALLAALGATVAGIWQQRDYSVCTFSVAGDRQRGFAHFRRRPGPKHSWLYFYALVQVNRAAEKCFAAVRDIFCAGLLSDFTAALLAARFHQTVTISWETGGVTLDHPRGWQVTFLYRG